MKSLAISYDAPPEAGLHSGEAALYKIIEQSEDDFMKAFECKQCGECCRGEGGIRVQGDEIGRIARFLSITPAEFLSKRCYFRHGRYYINTGADGFCSFFEREKQCTIHPVKPLPCTLWPFYPALLNDHETWIMAQDACPGINPRSSFEEFQRQSRG